jgi:AraC-type transcriptional regulator
VTGDNAVFTCFRMRPSSFFVFGVGTYQNAGDMNCHLPTFFVRVCLSLMNYGHRVCELGCAVPYLLANGELPGKVLKRVGFPTPMLLDPDAWVPRELFLTLVNALSSATDDPHCGIHIGEMESIAQFDAFGEAILAAPTLRAAIGVAFRRTALIQTGTEIRLNENRLTARLSYSFLGRAGENPAQYVQGVLVFFQKVLALTGQSAVLKVSFDHVPSQKSQELERVFGPQLAFRAEENAVVFGKNRREIYRDSWD